MALTNIKTVADLDTEASIAAHSKAVSTLQGERAVALADLVHTFSNGVSIQVRPGDIANLRLAIVVGASEDWVTRDNKVAVLTTVQMREALDSGIAQGKVVWNTYTSALKLITS